MAFSDGAKAMRDKARRGDLEIVCQIDTVGPEDGSVTLSLRRRAAVTSYLFSPGLDKNIVRKLAAVRMAERFQHIIEPGWIAAREDVAG